LALKTLITEAVKRPGEDDALAEVLARLPRQTPGALARVLLHVVDTRPLPLAMTAARALARMANGQGQVFLLEALAKLAGPPVQCAGGAYDPFDQAPWEVLGRSRRRARAVDEEEEPQGWQSLGVGTRSLLRADPVQDTAAEDEEEEGDDTESGDALLSEELPALSLEEEEGLLINALSSTDRSQGGHSAADEDADEDAAQPQHRGQDAAPAEEVPEVERQRRALLALGIVGLLDLQELGHAWPRMRWILLRADAGLKAQLCRLLAKTPQRVPPQHWAPLVEADLGDEALVAFVDAFGELLTRGQGAEQFSRRLRGLISLGEALIDRLDASPNALKVRQNFCHYLARALATQSFSTRHLMMLLDRLQRSELRRAFLSEMRPLMAIDDADLDDNEVLRVLFTRRASWLQQQRFSRAPYERLTRALAQGRRRAIDEALDLLPLPPTADLCRPLLEVIQRDDPEVSLRAAELLTTVRHGQGAVFLIEALLTPNLHIAPELIDLLDLGALDTAWIRLPVALQALTPRHRQHLIQRLIDDALRVPPWRWESIILACDPHADLPIVLRYFQSVTLKALRHAHLEEANPLQTLRAISDALIRRLALVAHDPPEIQAAIVELLTESAARDTTTIRRLLQLLEQTTSPNLRRALLLQMIRRVDVITSHLVDEAVAVCVHIVERRQEPFTSLALGALRFLSGLGNPTDWEPLLSCPGDEPRWAVMRALARQEGDVSAALHNVLNTPDPESRRAAASLIGRRLSRGHSIRDEALTALSARIAQDPDRAVANSLDVQTIFHFASPRAARSVALAVLRTPHAALLDRTLKALGDNALREHIIETQGAEVSAAGGLQLPDALCAHIVHLCVHPRCQAGSRRLDAVLRLLTAPDLLAADVLRALRPLLGSLDLKRIDAIVDRLQNLPDPLWQSQCAVFQALRAHQPADAPLDQVHAWSRNPPQEPEGARHHMAWLLRPALTHPDLDARTHALRLAADLADPHLLPDLLDALAAAPSQKAMIMTARALAALRHLGALAPLEALAAHPDCPGEVRRLTQSLRSALQPRILSSRFAWPSAHAAPKPARAALRPLRLLSGAVALTDPPPQRWWRSDDPYPGRTLGLITFSVDLWRQRDPSNDAMISWRLPWSLSVSRAPLSESVADQLPLILRFEQMGQFECVTPTVKVWVLRDPFIDALPELNIQAPFVAPPDVPALLSGLRWLLQRYDVPLPLPELIPS
jgi:hypothetical protein